MKRLICEALLVGMRSRCWRQYGKSRRQRQPKTCNDDKVQGLYPFGGRDLTLHGSCVHLLLFGGLDVTLSCVRCHRSRRHGYVVVLLLLEGESSEIERSSSTWKEILTKTTVSVPRLG